MEGLRLARADNGREGMAHASWGEFLESGQHVPIVEEKRLPRNGEGRGRVQGLDCPRRAPNSVQDPTHLRTTLPAATLGISHVGFCSDAPPLLSNTPGLKPPPLWFFPLLALHGSARKPSCPVLSRPLAGLLAVWWCLWQSWGGEGIMFFFPPANSRSYAVGGTPAASAPGMHGLFAPPPPLSPLFASKQQNRLDDPDRLVQGQRLPWSRRTGAVWALGTTLGTRQEKLQAGWQDQKQPHS